MTTSSYDYLIIGSGMSALSVGSLLANAGARVLMLEAHSVPGGYAHTFSRGEYEFTAEVHYTWGCEPGGVIYEFLKQLNLHEDITFTKFAADGYDHAVLPDGKRVKIPYGFDNLINNIDAAYPNQRPQLQRFFKVINDLRREMQQMPAEVHWWHYLTKCISGRNIIYYRNYTLQDLFNECQLSIEAQAVLCADAGNFGAPPNELSLLAYVSLFGGYDRGAYAPTKHFKYFMQRLAQFIADQPGCDVLYNKEVTDIAIQSGRVAYVTTRDGEHYTAENYICNMDPQKASHIIGHDKFPARYLPALSYNYAPSSFLCYVGVKGIDLRDYGFGNFNIWHLEQWDMNKMFQEAMHGDFSAPWLFLSTPTLHGGDTSAAPPGGQTFEFGTITSYNYFAELEAQGPEVYQRVKQQTYERFLSLIEEKYIPNLRDHIDVVTVGSPLNNERYCLAPFGNCYGSHLTPKNMGLGRLTATTPWPNLYWCNASSGYAGIYGTTLTGVNLFNNIRKR